MKDMRGLTMNVKEASQLLGICERKLRQLVYDNEIENIRIGSRVLFTEELLISYLKKQIVECK